MKAKVKLDMTAIKAWVLGHGEKLAFGIVLVVFLLFTVSAARREVLDPTKDPDKLRQAADAVRRHVAGSKWDEKSQNIQIVDYSKRTTRDNVEPKSYAMLTPFNPPVIDPKGRREDPKLFNAEELQVGGGFGSFALKGDGSTPAGQPAPAVAPKNAPPPAGQIGMAANAGRIGQGITGLMSRRAMGPTTAVQRQSSAASQSGHGVRPTPTAKLEARGWAVVTGLVPVEKQRQEYAHVFERAVGADPQRDTPHYAGTKVERAEIDNANPDKLDWKPLKDPTIFEEKWETSVGELIAQDLVDPNFTGLLGPLVGTDWGDAIAHAKIPLTKSSEPPPSAEPAKEADKPEEGENKEPAQPAVNDFIGRKSRIQAAVVPQIDTATPAPAAIAFKLLRVFDYSVEPGKRYRYRVKLALENPNYRVPDKYLKNPEKRPEELRRQFVMTPEWSEPTDIITIPSGYGVLAGGGLRSRSASDVTKAKLLLTAIDKEKGIEATVEKELERGTVANANEKKLDARDPRTDQTIELPEVHFKSNMVVLDIAGGKPLTRLRDSLLSPVEVLLLDANGNMTVRNELDDHQLYESSKPPADADTHSASKTGVPGDDDSKSKRKKK